MVFETTILPNTILFYGRNKSGRFKMILAVFRQLILVPDLKACLSCLKGTCTDIFLFILYNLYFTR